ncbi:MAG TPA: DUF3500 domain-containing protein [Gemmataceae bacterium]|nr:DUF3500 domain-containing protein [Gemmataceae bacterium]
MKLHRLLLAVAALAGVVGIAYVAQENQSAGVQMTEAADKFLAGLSAEQKEKATYDFENKERTNWHFVPRQDANKRATRAGLPLEEMTADQKKAALALVKAGTSEIGYTKATTIMSLEAILAELEKGGAMVRNPDWYFFTIFGVPSKNAKWGWRVEGHHLSLNFVIDKGKVVASTPAFFGANPATVQGGPRKGLRTLAEAEDLAKQLFKSLDEEQRQLAYQAKQFPEIEEAKSAPNVGEAKGLPAAKMTEEQRDSLAKLLQSYTSRMPPEVAKVEMAELKQAGIDKIHFAYAGGVEPGKPYSYRIQGPTFVVEFLNVQPDSAKNPANHIHSAWRNIKGDFGIPVN